ncbi:capsular exopolysaccharide synthesis family protein [Sinobacterium caligoides]|uniref:Capsular exopolysaccharide synthesis family protein n=1 Tax=Sinobacterium caligoides TaxID=933926 RepID=A0A3N2E1Z7_9GAMM|nr:CpsD/CapB family tyrosine-protein kinase [Sinobacterium caligoides]ROS06130.1 capsular exopolysaccharide synthesis family protein [Sinobacterium caligoides]
MEYVQEAIAKARSQRHSKFDGANATGESKENKVQDLTKITYSETKIQKLNKLHLERERVITALSSDKRAEPYRQLRTILLKTFREKGYQSLALVSADKGAGKTLTAINLAVELSKEVNQTVLLVDLDLKSPSIAKTLGLEVGLGVRDIIEGNAEVCDVLINPDLERLVVLPALKVEGNTSEILSSPSMIDLMHELEKKYPERIVIYDLPPLLNDDDAIVIGGKVDAALLVVEDGVTSKEGVERCRVLLDSDNFIGTILNKSE